MPPLLQEWRTVALLALELQLTVFRLDLNGNVNVIKNEHSKRFKSSLSDL